MADAQQLKARFLHRLHERHPAFAYHHGEADLQRDISCYFSDFPRLVDLLERYCQAGIGLRKKSIRERIRPLIGVSKTSPFHSTSTFPENVYDEEGNSIGVRMLMLPTVRMEALGIFLDATVDAFIEAIRDVREARKLEPAVKATPRPTDFPDKFNPNACGGKELCIVVSWYKSGKEDVRGLAVMLKNKAGIKYKRSKYSDPAEWYKKAPAGFRNHCYKLRKRAKRKEWYKDIPDSYWERYRKS